MNILDVIKLCFNKEQVKMMRPVATNYFVEGKKLEWHPDWKSTLDSQDAVYFFIERATGKLLKIGETAATVRKLINRMYDYNSAACPLGKFMTMPGSPSVQVIALPLDNKSRAFPSSPGKISVPGLLAKPTISDLNFWLSVDFAFSIAIIISAAAS